MAEEHHQGVDADFGVGELGGEGVAQPVHERATRPVGIDADTAERLQHPVQSAARDPLTICTHEQRRARRPGGQSPGGGAGLSLNPLTDLVLSGCRNEESPAREATDDSGPAIRQTTQSILPLAMSMCRLPAESGLFLSVPDYSDR